MVSTVSVCACLCACADMFVFFVCVCVFEGRAFIQTNQNAPYHEKSDKILESFNHSSFSAAMNLAAEL